MSREQFSGNLITLDLTDEQRDDAPGALRRAACLASGSDAALLRLVADQLDEARAESREIDIGDGYVDCVFTPREQARS